MQLRLAVDGLEKERDFYFGKLRDIEMIAQEVEEDTVPCVDKITKILYATEVRFVCETVYFPPRFNLKEAFVYNF